MLLEKKVKSILVVCPYPVGVAAGQRLKYEQYFENWEKNGFSITVSSYMDNNFWHIAHKKGFWLKKIFAIFKGQLKRCFEIFLLYKYDCIYIFMYVTPLGTSLMERLYCFFAKKIIFDLEDNRFVGANKETSGMAQKMRGISKTEYLVRNANHVITSSPDLSAVCKEKNIYQQTTYITSSVDTQKFVPNNRYQNNYTVNIGWTGTFSTRPYLDLLNPVFLELKKLRNFKLVVIGNFDYALPEIDVEYITWTAENEVKDLQKIDIGLYPLPMDDEQWISGKSGLKAIQYMAFGIPAICSNIGNVKKFIINNENGILVNTTQDWIEALLKLIDDAELRKTIGINGRITAEENFSKQVVANQYLKILNEVINK